MTIFIYGPPGSGKTSVGNLLAQKLNLPFVDLDEVIEEEAGSTIPEIFAMGGEASFRRREKTALEKLLKPGSVVSLGGGALLDGESRQQVQLAGPVLCLNAPLEVLLERLRRDENERPLIAYSHEGGNSAASATYEENLKILLAQRQVHYNSFHLQLDTSTSDLENLVWKAQVILGRFFVRGMGVGYPVEVSQGGLSELGYWFDFIRMRGPVALVCDENVAPLYAGSVVEALEKHGYTINVIQIPAGEQSKNVRTVENLWGEFLSAGLDRGSTAIALGGGVINDLVGFAAATYLRGISWVAAPTTLLGMVDASLGGKTGVDLSQGKNLVGAFHAPRLVLADPATIETLPVEEVTSGMAEVVKAGVIGDALLFGLCSQGWETVKENWEEIIRRSMAVKIRIIEEDPYEKGRRASLNLGHTIGHAVELVSGFKLRHGEAVAIGMVAETRLAERLGLAEKGLTNLIQHTLQVLDLPIEIPGDMDSAYIIQTMRVDKKKSGGVVRLALPVAIGEVRYGIGIEDLGALF
jgi:shikimate kinase/3-dehydroquinate synthase